MCNNLEIRIAGLLLAIKKERELEIKIKIDSHKKKMAYVHAQKN